MTKREWTIVLPHDKRHYGSDLTVLRGWLWTYQANPRAKVTCHTDNGPVTTQSFLKTLSWPQVQIEMLPPNLTPEQETARNHHIGVCLQVPDAVLTIMAREHRCEWFDLQAALNKRQNAELRANARRLTQWVDQQIAAG